MSAVRDEEGAALPVGVAMGHVVAQDVELISRRHRCDHVEAMWLFDGFTASSISMLSTFVRPMATSCDSVLSDVHAGMSCT